MKFPNKIHLKLNEFVKDYAYEMQKAYDSIDLEELDEIASLLINSIKDKKTIYTCGNGGSAAISEHFVCDFLKGASTDTSIQPIIYSFTSNTPTLTAVANDISYEEVFSFQIESQFFQIFLVLFFGFFELTQNFGYFSLFFKKNTPCAKSAKDSFSLGQLLSHIFLAKYVELFCLLPLYLQTDLPQSSVQFHVPIYVRPVLQ